MLTNPFETQMIESLGVKVGRSEEPARPFAHLRASLEHPLGPGVIDEGGPGAAPPAAGGSGCPFAEMVTAQGIDGRSGIRWNRDAEARAERIPSFIRPMAKRAIERFAEEKGYATITEAIMNEARAALGM
jgi:hypothetical protein